MVHLIIGKASAGKTTYGKELQEKSNGKAVLIDSDQIGGIFGRGFSEDERKIHLIRLAKLGRAFNLQGFDVIICAIVPKIDWRYMILAHFYDQEKIVTYVQGGFLWSGTEFEEPEENDNVIFYDWRKP